MSATLAIQTIQQIKDSVERPEICARLGSFEPNCSKQLRAARYTYGAVKIMDLLRNELTANEIEGYKRRYDACIHSNDWCRDQLAAAKDLWNYVLCLDQSLSDERIRTTGARTHVVDEAARSVCPTTCIEPLNPQLARAPAISSMPPAAYLRQSSITWYPTVLVPAYCYPGLVWLPLPNGSDKA